MITQTLLISDGDYRALDRHVRQRMGKKIFLVHGASFEKIKVGVYLRRFAEENGITFIPFKGPAPNPKYEAVVKGVERFCQAGCDSIIAVGGGSIMDTAKCVKLWAGLSPERNYLEQTLVPNEIPLLAVPTTAGSGSEATQFAVIYYKGEKRSVYHESCIPSAVLLDPSALETLPAYHRKAAMLDALCHGIESFWSLRSTEESRKYSEEAIRGVLRHLDDYLDNRESGRRGMLWAAHLAGKAINIAQTTAGHAMSYKLTSLYDIPHGYAAALCVSRLWPYMLENPEQWADPRGKAYLGEIFGRIAAAMGAGTSQAGVRAFREILRRVGRTAPACTQEEIWQLARSVDPVRMKNQPVSLGIADFEALYQEILCPPQ